MRYFSKSQDPAGSKITLGRLRLGLKTQTIFKMADSEALDSSGSPNETDDVENRLVIDVVFCVSKYSS